MSVPRNPNRPETSQQPKKKRSVIFIVVVVSIVAHLIAGSILAVIKIIDTIEEPPRDDFVGETVIEEDTPQPPLPVQTPKRTSSAMPRPEPLATTQAQDLEAPLIQIDHSAPNFAGTSASGSPNGFGDGIPTAPRIDFIGVPATGNNIAVLFDRSFSSIETFERTRTELTTTIEQMRQVPDARLLLVYFGGKVAGQLGLEKEDPTKFDFWFPKNVPGNRWLRPQSRNVENILKELNSVEDPGAPQTKVNQAKDLKGEAFFVLGTQYWGALNATFRMQPAPDTVYFMVEPRIAFPDIKKVEDAYAKYAQFGAEKPPATKVYFIVGKPKHSVKNAAPMRKMVDLINGSGLTPQQIDQYIIYD